MDKQIRKDIACRGASLFNKESYYVDLDFDCSMVEEEDIDYDIYGSSELGAPGTPDIYGPNAEEPEICRD